MPKWIIEDMEYSPQDRELLPEGFKHFGDYDGRFFKGVTDGDGKPPVAWTDDLDEAMEFPTKAAALFFCENTWGVLAVGSTDPFFPVRKDRVK